MGASMGLPKSLKFGTYAEISRRRRRKRVQLRHDRYRTGHQPGRTGGPHEQEEHLSMARELMRRADQESAADGGNEMIAAEFLWGALAHCLITVAQNEGLPHDSHGAFSRIAQHLDGTQGGNEWRFSLRFIRTTPLPLLPRRTAGRGTAHSQTAHLRRHPGNSLQHCEQRPEDKHSRKTTGLDRNGGTMEPPAF